jgi:hypothetical protein
VEFTKSARIQAVARRISIDAARPLANARCARPHLNKRRHSLKAGGQPMQMLIRKLRRQREIDETTTNPSVPRRSYRTEESSIFWNNQRISTLCGKLADILECIFSSLANGFPLNSNFGSSILPNLLDYSEVEICSRTKPVQYLESFHFIFISCFSFWFMLLDAWDKSGDHNHLPGARRRWNCDTVKISSQLSPSPVMNRAEHTIITGRGSMEKWKWPAMWKGSSKTYILNHPITV